jgi:hypothetical protein
MQLIVVLNAIDRCYECDLSIFQYGVIDRLCELIDVTAVIDWCNWRVIDYVRLSILRPRSSLLDRNDRQTTDQEMW